MISLYVNCAKVWTHLVPLSSRLTRRPQVTFQATTLDSRGANHR